MSRGWFLICAWLSATIVTPTVLLNAQPPGEDCAACLDNCDCECDDCDCEFLGFQSLWDQWEAGHTPELRDGRYFDPYGWQFVQDPFRLGFLKHDELTFQPAASAQGTANGSMQFTEFYSSLKFSTLLHPDLLVSLTGNADGQFLSGPQSPALPGQLGRLSLDMETVILGQGPITTAIGFHPQLVTDDQSHLTGKALSFDGRIVNTHQVSRDVRLVYGFAFWNRVDLLVIPELGAVWTPDDRWELRLLFPRSQFSYRLGDIGGGQMWLTSTAEYTVQAYQVELANPVRIDRIQLQDWRISAGVRQDFFDSSWMADIGIVLDRHIKYQGPTPSFDLAPTAMFRIGIWF